MSITPKPGQILLISGLIDRALGADALTPGMRQNVLRRQLQSIAPMAPVLLVASLVLSVVLLITSAGQAWFWLLTASMGSLLVLQLVHTHRSGRRTEPLRADEPNRAAAFVVLQALLLGTLWGVVLHLVLSGGGTPHLPVAASLGAGGLLCVAAVALINYPLALLAFGTPLTVGTIGPALGLAVTAEGWALAALVAGFAVILVGLSFKRAADFVTHSVAEATLEETRDVLGLLLREFEPGASGWVWGLDADGAVNQMSSGVGAAMGVEKTALIGADFVHFMQCITPPDDPLVARLERDVAARRAFHDVDLRVLAGGDECWWRLSGKPMFDAAGNYRGYIGTGTDVSALKAAERRTVVLAHQDGMTGLSDRTKFTEQLDSCVGRLNRYGTSFAVMFLDLDKFGAINDSYGHRAGDRLLMQVARRIEALAHEPDLVARLYGDVFAVLLPNRPEIGAVETLADALIADLGRPYSLDGNQVRIGASIGIAMAPLSGTGSDQIMRHAQLALDQAKNDGRGIYRCFESRLDSDARARRMLEVELREAIVNRELVLHYQPVVAARDEAPLGFEALIRWNHPVRGLVPPVEFIPAAEHSDLIVQIGDWTIEQACLAASNWPDHLTVSVNLSAKHFRRSDIAVVVEKALAVAGLAPQRLEIEITEVLLMDDCSEVVAKLAQIRDLGVSIVMDDFGAGYSSLSHLLKFPFDKIKLDRAFVMASSENVVGRDVLKAIIALGRTLKLSITAEGVETQEQAEFLREFGCDQLQGFHFARPLDPVALPYYLMTRFADRAQAVRAETEARLISVAS